MTLNQLEVLSLSSQDPEGYKMFNTGVTVCWKALQAGEMDNDIIYNVDHVSVKCEMMG